MRHFRSVCAIVALVLMASCAPRREPPAPAPAPPPLPPQPPAPPPLDWQDAPPSPGDWSYRAEGAGSSAAFGVAAGPTFIFRCDAGRSISLVRAGASSGSSLIIRTTFGNRALPATVQPDGLVASLAAADPLLDQMVFSRGRFAVQAEGQTLLIVPAWPEPARVIEDCRG
jgi:hypothetical protein